MSIIIQSRCVWFRIFLKNIEIFSVQTRLWELPHYFGVKGTCLRGFLSCVNQIMLPVRSCQPEKLDAAIGG